jgi:hypothetical protein
MYERPDEALSKRIVVIADVLDHNPANIAMSDAAPLVSQTESELIDLKFAEV